MLLTAALGNTVLNTLPHGCAVRACIGRHCPRRSQKHINTLTFLSPSTFDSSALTAHEYPLLFCFSRLILGYSYYTAVFQRGRCTIEVMPVTCITSRFRTRLGGSAFGPPTFFTILTDSGVLTRRAVPKRVG